MFLEPAARNNLMTLLRLAREEAEDLRADLADIHAALNAAEISISALEENTPPADKRQDSAAEDRVRARRMRLFAMHEMLDRRASEIQSKLGKSTAELQKLERLVSIGADSSRSDMRLTMTAPRAGGFAALRTLAS